MAPCPPPPDPLLELVSSKEYDRKDIKVSNLQANAKLAQKGEHQTRMAEVPNLILTAGNIFSLDFFSFHVGKPLMAITPLGRFKKNLPSLIWDKYATRSFTKKKYSKFAE